MAGGGGMGGGMGGMGGMGGVMEAGPKAAMQAPTQSQILIVDPPDFRLLMDRNSFSGMRSDHQLIRVDTS